MHILGLIITFLGVAAFWWFRMKHIREAGGEIIDAAGRARGKMRRNKIRKATAESPVAAIDNPIVAASTLLVHLAIDSPLPPKQEEAVRLQLEKISDGEALDEALIYGKWVQNQHVDTRKATNLLCEKLSQWLTVKESNDVIAMIRDLQEDSRIELDRAQTDLALRKLAPQR